VAGEPLLLDTHVFIWWREDNPCLGASARAAIAEAAVVFVSAASAWEASIKASLGKLRLSDNFAAGVAASRFEKLPIRFSHAEAVADLPHHHGDPFDRMLVAQALVERLVLVTHDRRLAPYDPKILWV
jgi:PIN domain nuclease of toxin-antitoxin system